MRSVTAIFYYGGGEGISALCAAPNPFLLKKICLNEKRKKKQQIYHSIINLSDERAKPLSRWNKLSTTEQQSSDE